MFILEIETEHPLLQDARRTVPEMEISYVEERILRESNEIRVLFEASGGDFERFEAALDADPTIASFQQISGDVNNRLYRISYHEGDDIESPTGILFEHDARILNAETTENGWWVRILFPTKRGLEAFTDWFGDRDIDYTVHKVLSPTYPETENNMMESIAGLTEKQYEAVQHAFRNGFFDIPRGATLNSLATDLGISDVAYSHRVRRGLSKILSHEKFDLERDS